MQFIQHAEKTGMLIPRTGQQWGFTCKTNCSLGKRNRIPGVNEREGKVAGLYINVFKVSK